MPSVFRTDPSHGPSADKVRFGAKSPFQAALKKRVDGYFARTGLPRRDLPGMYAKAGAVLLWFGASWVGLVFFATTVWAGVLLAVSLGLSIAGIGMCIMHDANHGAFSKNKRINALFGWTCDAMGASSFVWKHKHNRVHHTWTNVHGIDDDLDVGVLGRLSPHQPRRAWHRLQHVYMWILYGLLMPKWVFIDDVAELSSNRVGAAPMARPTTADYAPMIAGKLTYFAWALIIPMLFHPVGVVLGFWFIAMFVTGLSLSTTFQLAHCVREVRFPEPVADDDVHRLQTDFATHQLATTVDFARRNKLLTQYVGGLNFQVVHHLFPRVCHLHYPALSDIVKEVAAEHGLRYRVVPSARHAVASHFGLLRQLGRPVAPVA